MLSRKSGVYLILNTINGKIYIGSAKEFYERFHTHKHYLSNGNHHNKHLQNAWNKYGSDNFIFVTLEETENVIEREQWWIDFTNCCDEKIGYNIRKDATSNLGLKFTTEHRAKMSAWQIGNVMPEETKLKISETLKGRIIADDVKLRMAAGHRKLDKWPCLSGWRCKCDECREKRNLYAKEYKAARGK